MPLYEPLVLSAPEITQRKKEKPRLVPLSKEDIEHRYHRYQEVVNKVSPLSDELKSASKTDKESLIFKIEHEIPIDLVGTDLKLFLDSNEGYSLAVPTSDNLDKLIRKIEEYGTAKIKKNILPNQRLVQPMKDFSKASPLDRLSSDFRKKYPTLIKKEWVLFEIEIVSLFERSEKKKTEEIISIVEDIKKVFINDSGVFYEHEDIHGTRRAVVGCTGKILKKIVEEKKWQRKISCFDERPQFETLSSIISSVDVNKLKEIDEIDINAPTVCVIDSGVSPGNFFLAPVVSTNLSKSFVNEDHLDDSGHGSGVASLVAYYSLQIADGASNEPKVKIASAKILDDKSNIEDDEGKLFSKCLREVVEYYVDKGIRIFNLSVNAVNKKWNRGAKASTQRKSWVARTIDNLSRKYNVLFVISAGNIHYKDIPDLIEKNGLYPHYFQNDDACLLDPAQSTHSITVGTISRQIKVVASPNKKAIAKLNQIAPFSRTGPGISDNIKPELVEIGGNYVSEANDEKIIGINIGTSDIVAGHDINNAVVNRVGTSYSAARVSHKAALLLKDLESFGINPSIALLKAFLVNSSLLPNELNLLHDEHNFSKSQLMNMYGYGIPDHIRATYSDDYSAILYYDGFIDADKVAFFDIPIPSKLKKSGNILKRMTITVVQVPEVQRWGLERYHGTELKWQVFRGNIDREEIKNAMSLDDEIEGEAADNLNDDEDSLPKGMKYKIGFNLRAKGTIQHDIIEWKIHKEEYSKNYYTLAISTFKRWGRKVQSVPFAVVIRIEETGNKISINNEIKVEIENIAVKTKVQI